MTKTKDGEIRQTTANDQPRSRLHWLVWVARYPQLAWEHRDVVWSLARLELLARFRGSILGVFWVLAQPPWLANLLKLNPAYPLLQAHRAVLGVAGGEPQWLWWHLGGATLWAAASMALGCAVFVRYRRELADLV